MPRIKVNQLSFSEWIRAWRIRMGFTQLEAAKSLQVSIRTFQGWEGSRYYKDKPAIRALAKQIEGAHEPDMVKPKKGKSVSAALDDWN